MKLKWKYSKIRKSWTATSEGCKAIIYKMSHDGFRLLCPLEIVDGKDYENEPYLWEFDKLSSAKTVANLMFFG